MAYSVESFRNVKNALDEKRRRAEAEADRCRELFHRKSERGAEIDRILGRTSMELFHVACIGGAHLDEKIAEMRKNNLALQEEKKALLRSLGLPENYTDVHYGCEECKDTGYDREGKLCRCMRKMLAEEEIRLSGIGHLVDTQTFANFSLEGLSPMTKKTVETCKAYAENFSPESGESLLLMGGTGLGKTHISTAIAKRVIEQGYRVVYESMQNILNDFQYDRFHSSQSPVADRYFNAELLIIDDLGTETPGAFTTTVLYQLINQRLNRHAPTVVSTNLFGQEIVARYDERINSRFFGSFKVLMFEGKDHRIYGEDR